MPRPATQTGRPGGGQRLNPWIMPGRLRAAEGGSDEPVVGRADAAQRRPVRRRGGRDRLGARSRLAGQRPAGLPERVRAHTATGGPPAAGAAGRLPRLHHRLCQQRERHSAHPRRAGRRRLPGRAGRLGGLAGPDPATAGRLRVATAIGRRGVASPVVWRSPCAQRRRAACFAWPSSSLRARGVQPGSFPSWAPSTVWPTSAWRWRPGSPTPPQLDRSAPVQGAGQVADPRPPRITPATIRHPRKENLS
jgi:hypothetical protein